MNIKDYIASGILEQYLLGELTASEEKEVEKTMSLYPEIRQEYFLLADTFEKMSQQAGITPPAGLKEKIILAVTGEESPRSNESSEIKKKSNRNTSYLLAALSIAALAGLLLTIGVFYNCSHTKDQLQQQITSLTAQVDQLTSEINNKEEEINLLQRNLQIIGSPDFNMVPLKGLPIAPQAFAQVFWNQTTSEVYLKADQLPKPETGKQYQLWAIVKNVPQSMGVFDLPLSNDQLLKMQNIEEAAAFAITLEPEGGVEVPTLEAMYVVGNIVSG